MPFRSSRSISDAELIDAAQRCRVFARVSPEQKLRMVKALQVRGEIVAMTGDGVNDAPALRRADIGVAMALSGTEVAREAADMILTDDNFASIEAAVEEGRGVYETFRNFIVWTLPTNGGQSLALLLTVLAGAPLPLQPGHSFARRSDWTSGSQRGGSGRTEGANEPYRRSWGFLMHRVEHLPRDLARINWSLRRTDCPSVLRAMVRFIVLRPLTER